MLEDTPIYGDLVAQRGTLRLLLGEAGAGLVDLLASARYDLSIRREVETVETALSLAAACAALGESELATVAYAAYQRALAIAAIEERSAAAEITRRFLTDVRDKIGTEVHAAARAEGYGLVDKNGPRLFLANLASRIEAALTVVPPGGGTDAS